MCRPLGIRLLSVANRNGGLGALPPDMRVRPAYVERCRALRIRGAPVRECGDDVSWSTNEHAHLGDLYWRQLE